MRSSKKFLKSIVVYIMSILMVTMVSSKIVTAGTADATYYNVGILTNTERLKVTGQLKGTVIVMSPTDNEVYVGEEAEELIINGTVQTICVTGVGSSSVGTAAFAKHIATIRNEYVAGITSGYGDISIGTEGYQGYFIGRSSNVLGTYYIEPASDKLAELYEKGAKPSLLVGHSKGNLDIANALFKMNIQGNSNLFKGVNFITFGCGVNVPEGLGSFNQYLGELDSLGKLNTVSYSNLTWVSGRYHTTNPYYSQTYMPIENYLK